MLSHLRKTPTVTTLTQYIAIFYWSITFKPLYNTEQYHANGVNA